MATIVKNTVLSFVKVSAMVGFGYAIDGTYKSQLPFAVKFLVLMACSISVVLVVMVVESLKGGRKQSQSTIEGITEPAKKEN
ncbi:unnamed protein product [Linum tenue]|uniref:Uncharacterized protein n=1 Tax=Linum tenue TaxID=586396 RepID=A0AAV0QY52_9ROSI|nr:unnamed protein product [Linum tenue]